MALVNGLDCGSSAAAVQDVDDALESVNHTDFF